MRAVKSIAALSLLNLAVPTATAAPPGVGKRIDALVEPYVASAQFNGVVVILEGGKTIFAKAYGMANYELGVPNRLDTRFKIASISKSVTDAALGVMFDLGKMTPQTRVSDLIPDFPRGDAITVRQLVDHRSGIAHINNLPEYDNVARMTLAQSIAILKTKPLDFDPGTRTSYSNGGFDVLAMMIEKASGMPFETFVQTRVLDTIGMRDTGVAETFKVVPRLADGYQPGDRFGVRARSRFYSAEARRGGGALYSTAADVARLFRTVLGGTFLSPASRSAIFGAPDRVHTPTGRSPGVSAIAYADPAKDVYVVALANNYTPIEDFGRRLYRAAAAEPAEPKPATVGDRKLTAADAGYYDGDYVFEGFGPGSRFRLAVQPDGRLLSISRYGEPSILAPLTDGRWFYPLFDTICAPQGGARLETLRCESPLGAGGSRYTIVRDDRG